jgi:hypothetical protein
MQRLVFSCLCLGFLLFGGARGWAADTEAAAESLYAVPDGGSAELLAFIQRVAQIRPTTAAEDIPFRTLSRPALRQAAEKILQLEKDSQSEAHQAARFLLTVERIRSVAQGDPEQQRQAIADVKQHVTQLAQAGQLRVAAELALLLGRTLMEAGEWPLAVDTYKSLSQLFAASQDEWILERMRAIEAEGPRVQAVIKELEAAGPKPVVRPTGRLVPLDLAGKTNLKRIDLSGPGDYEGNGQAELPPGDHTLGGVLFRLGDGVIQLGSARGPEKPEAAEGILVQRKIARVHVLHAGQWTPDEPLPRRPVIGEFLLHYADGSTASLPIVYGVDVREWWTIDGGKPVTRGRVVWTGANLRSDERGVSLRLYGSVWENPHPDREVTALDYVSYMTNLCSPFCVAITVEEREPQ